MNSKIKALLLKIMNNGHKAYIVGGFVRDYILGLETYDVDICTSASPKEIKNIFDLNNTSDDSYGCVQIKDSIYNYDITTFRVEDNYKSHNEFDVKFVKDVNEDAIRRDFTINSMYMDFEGNIYDPYDGREDIQNRIIRVVGDLENKISSDPLRILRAIRFASNLDFTIDKYLYDYIKLNKQLISTISFSRKKAELDLIFKNDHKGIGLKLIKELGLEGYLEIEYDDIVPTKDPLGIWAQINYSSNYQFSKNDEIVLNKIRKIVEYGTVDNYVLYQNGLYPCVIAGEILGIDRTDISSIYASLPIYSTKDINIDGDMIKNILNIEGSSIIKNIIFDIELNIIDGVLDNEYYAIKEYIIKNWSDKCERGSI